MTQTIRVNIAGMTCAHCEQTVEKALSMVGASESTADFRRGQATFRWPEGEDVQVAEKAVRNAGYRTQRFEILNPATRRPGARATLTASTISPYWARVRLRSPPRSVLVIRGQRSS